MCFCLFLSFPRVSLQKPPSFLFLRGFYGVLLHHLWIGPGLHRRGIATRGHGDLVLTDLAAWAAVPHGVTPVKLCHNVTVPACHSFPLGPTSRFSDGRVKLIAQSNSFPQLALLLTCFLSHPCSGFSQSVSVLGPGWGVGGAALPLLPTELQAQGSISESRLEK